MSQVQREQLKVAAEKAVLVQVQLPRQTYDAQDPFHELRALACTAGASVVGELVQRRDKPSGRCYLGKGKVVELARLVEAVGATLVIFDNDLTPSQIKNLEEETACKIIDRSELILDIFANRATTHAARLQVEIAQLEYTYPRLRAMWTHLGQIVGGAPVGIGTRGPGEKQLEIDRRIVQQRLRHLRSELDRIQARKSREVAQRNLDHYTVGLVGYTNAGKSTLFNRLTAGGAFAHSKPFATLSTRIERWELGGGNAAMLSDTVGFIRDLPHHLVASFRSTLEETVCCRLILVVLDVCDPHARDQLETVKSTLDEIGAVDQPRILVLNKIDELEDRNLLLPWLNRWPDAVAISAATGAGVEDLAERVAGHVVGVVRQVVVELPLGAGRSIEFLESRTEIVDRTYDDGRVRYTVRLGRRQAEQLLARGDDPVLDGQRGGDAVARLWPPEAPAAEDRRAGVPPHIRHWMHGGS